MVGIPKTLRGRLIAAGALILVLLAARQLFLRWHFEAQDNLVEVCIDLEQSRKICARYSYPLASLLERARTIGVNSLVVQEETFDSLRKNASVAYFSTEDAARFDLLGAVGPGSSLQGETLVVKGQKLAEYLRSVIKIKTRQEPKEYKVGGYTVFRLNRSLTETGWGYLPENAETARAAGLQLVYKPYKEFWVEENPPNNFSGLILSGAPDAQSLAALRISGAKLAVIEFSMEENLYRRLFAPVAGQVFRMHRIEPERLQRAFPVYPGERASGFVNRLVRAARERNCRMLYFDFIEGLSLEDNLNYLRDTCTALKKSGFLLGGARKPRPFEPLPQGAAKALAFIMAVVAPIICAFYVSRKTRDVTGNLLESARVFIYASGITLAGAFLVSAVLSGPVFSVKLDEFEGIRSAMVLAFLAAIPVIVKRDKLLKFFIMPQSVGIIAIIAVSAAAAYIILVRTGNVAEIPQSESAARSALESVFTIRPRFKEFLFGHPLMLLGLFLDSAPLLIAGMVGQISLMNTFMHAHTPFTVSLVRTVYGLVLGSAAGCVLIFAYEMAPVFFKSLKK
jgi:hypothetical protein